MIEQNDALSSVFHGTKLVLLVGECLVALKRDDKPGISWPGLWDLPGGGREGDETPQACVLRELAEETGLALTHGDLSRPVLFGDPPHAVWFFARQPAPVGAALCLGDEGQALTLMTPEAFCAHPAVIPHFPDRVRALIEIFG